MREHFDTYFFRICVVSALVIPACFLLCRLGRLRKVNWQGKAVPSSMGISFLVVWVSSCFIYYPYSEHGTQYWFSSFLQVERYGWTLFIFLVGFGVVGLIDDLWGTRAYGGLHGHFRELFTRRRLTTGTVKAIGGVTVSLWGAYLWVVRINPTHFGTHYPIPSFLLSGMLVALCANTGNLLDVRPSRALKGLAILLTLTWLLAYCMPGIWLHPDARVLIATGLPLSTITILLLIPVGLYAPLDFRSKAMMGDVGSNALGALAGWYAMTTLSLPGQAILVVLLLVFHIWTEKHSLTEFLARHPVLDWLDRLGTGRPPEFARRT